MNVHLLLITKIQFIVCLLLYSMNASASYFLECTGYLTLDSGIKTTRYYQDKVYFFDADIYIYDRTFNCEGHGSEIDVKGTIKNAKIYFPETFDVKTLKSGTNLQVEYSHVTSMLPSDKASTETRWTLLKAVKDIPHKPLPKTTIKSKPKSELISEGVDLSVEESLWGENKESFQGYIDLERNSLGNEQARYTKKLYSIYRGDLFKIIYPKSFISYPLNPIVRFDANSYQNEQLEVEPKLPPKYLEYVDTEDAYFKSPDNLVEFFVYAKDSSNPPKSYTKTTENEIEIRSSSEKFSYKKEHLNYVIKAWVTIKAKDTSYYRSYIHQRACNDDYSQCETQVIGIKYTNIEAYKKYRDFFIAFNRSLTRTAEF